MESLFENITEDGFDECPILLIDNSGSTMSVMKNGNMVLSNFGLKMTEILSSKKIDKCRILFWDTEATVINDIVSVNNIVNEANKIGPKGGTDVSVAFKFMPNDWLNDKTIADIYLLTDGDTGLGKYNFPKRITKLFKKHNDKKIRLYIVSIQCGTTDYLTNDYDAGNAIYRMLREQKLMKYVKSFISYNNMYFDEPYCNYSNPDLSKGMIPFRNKCFKITKVEQFISYLSDLIEENKTDEQSISKIAFDLAITLHSLTKDKPVRIKNGIVDMFSKLFVFSKRYAEIRQSLFMEVANHEIGTATTFQEYRNNRSKLFERAQESLNNDVKQSLSAIEQRYFCSVPLQTGTNEFTIYKVSNDKMNSTINMGYHTYQNAGIKINNHTIPLLPTNIHFVEFNNQCIRQWIRAIYSKTLNLTANDDMLLYMFLTEMLKVYMSDVDSSIKKAYSSLGLIMLDRKRYNSGGKKEIEHLLEGNPPLAVLDSFNKIDDILAQCAKMNGFKIKPYTLWMAIMIATENEELVRSQIQHCISDVKADYPDVDIFYDPDSLIHNMKKHITYKFREVQIGMNDDNEYYCYVTMEDTTDSGGYRLPIHTVAGKIECDPKYVISEDGFNFIKKDEVIKCPLCCCNLSVSDVSKISAKHDLEYDMSRETIQCKSFDNTMHEIISIDKFTHKSNKLYKIDDLDFDVSSYSFLNLPAVVSKMNNGVMTTRSLMDFHLKILRSNYSFLMEIDMENVCIAGGFCKSILLNQPINDIDFFLYDLEDDEYIPRFNKLVNDLLFALDTKNGNIVFFTMYKENNNVFEILCLENLSEERNIDINYVQQNLDKFNVRCKLQIILTKNRDISKIFDNFDLQSCRVAYTGNQVYFDKLSHDSYKYMINIVDEKKYTELFDARLLKYYNSGFSMVLPDLDIAKINSNDSFSLGKLAFNDTKIKGSMIYSDVFFNPSSDGEDIGSRHGMYNSLINNTDDTFGESKSSALLDKTIRYIFHVNGLDIKTQKSEDDSDDDSNSDIKSEEMIYYNFINKSKKMPYDKFMNGSPEIVFTDEINKKIDYDWYAGYRKNQKHKQNNKI